MDSDNDSYFEESSSEEEQEVAAPLNIQVAVNLVSPESPPPQAGSPPVLPAPIPVGELAPVWELNCQTTGLTSSITLPGLMSLN